MKLPFINESIFEPNKSLVEIGESSYLYLYLYIYITETFEAPTIFHIIILIYKKN